MDNGFRKGVSPYVIGCSKQLLQNQFVIRAFLRRETNRGEKNDTMKTIMEIITVKVIARQLPNKDQVQKRKSTRYTIGAMG